MSLANVPVSRGMRLRKIRKIGNMATVDKTNRTNISDKGGT